MARYLPRISKKHKDLEGCANAQVGSKSCGEKVLSLTVSSPVWTPPIGKGSTACSGLYVPVLYARRSRTGN